MSTDPTTITEAEQDQLLLQLSRLLSVDQEACTGDWLVAIIWCPESHVQQEAVRLLARVMGPTMPWRELLNLIQACSEFRNDKLLEEVTDHAERDPAPWHASLDSTTPTPNTRYHLHGLRPVPMRLAMVLELERADPSLIRRRLTHGISNPSQSAMKDFDPEDWRMFSSKHNYDDWLGTCHSCSSRIPSLGSALRVPLPDGGWVGYYCGPICLASTMLSSPIVDLYHSPEEVAATLFLLEELFGACIDAASSVIDDLNEQLDAQTRLEDELTKFSLDSEV